MYKPWDLPKELEIGGKMHEIRTDYRVILDVISVFNDPDMEIDEKWIAALIIMIPNFETITTDELPEACEKVMEFIDCGRKSEHKDMPAVMDWEQDASIIFPAVNRVLGREVRSVEYMHWWTFIGAYMEIGESLFSSVVSIRSKRAKGKKLDKEEQDFFRDNQKLILLKPRLSAEEEAERKAEEEALRNLVG